MPEADGPYCNVKFTRARENTDDSQRAAVSAGRSWATSGRVALLVLSVLLVAAVVALRVTFYQNIQTKKSLQQLQDKYDAVATNLTNETCKCDVGWEPHGGKCYFFSPYDADWDNTRKICQVLGGHLVVIESREEQRFLESRLREKMEHAEDKFWIGLTDAKTEGEWLWVDGSRLDERVTFWIGYEPDNWKMYNLGGENCVGMGEKVGARNLKCWFDKNCIELHKSICEKQERKLPHTCV
uniref:C-type lectin domain-containing protein n=1 Tax=Scophthalmus maximus TaxID=52904 RepID=A0A8D3D4F5_SCOMX